MRPYFFPTFAFLLFGLSPALADERPDFIFFLTDDISISDLGVYDSEAPLLPNLQRLAERGMVFENFYVATSSCSPSRCSFLTGRYPHNHGAPELHQPLPPGQVMFPALMQRDGYYTALAGKNHMGPQPGIHAFTDVFEGKGVSRSEDWVDIYENRPKDRPSFFWFASDDAHHAWQPDSDFHEPDPQTFEVPPFLVDDAATRKDLAGYHAEVRRTDHHLGLLLDAIERAGRLENTYIIYTSDNGRPFPRCKTHLFDSGTRVPFLIAGPGIPAGRRTESLASAIDLAATFCELAGVESPRTHRFQGPSMTGVLQDPDHSHRDVVFAERNWHISPAHERMVREGPWVYLWNAWPDSKMIGPESGRAFPAGVSLAEGAKAGTLAPHQRYISDWPRPVQQLFHLDRDPHQLENLTDNPDYKLILTRLQNHLAKWKQETGDTEPAFPEKPREKKGDRELPGDASNAVEINEPGPVQVDGEFELIAPESGAGFDWGELQPPHYLPLPPGSISPKGWLREQLETMATGLTGNLDETYAEVIGERNGWLGGDGDGWERGPYWIDGLLPLAHLLDDEDLLAKANRWIEWTLTHQRDDGYLGPIPFETAPKPEPGLQKDRRRDWWPKMVMLKVLQQHFLATGDKRVIECLERYFRFQLEELPKTPLGHWSYWATRRAGDNIHVVHWLYSITREPYLLELSDLLIKQGYPWTRDFAEGSKVRELRFSIYHGTNRGYHCVNLAHGLKTPILEWQRHGDPAAIHALNRGIGIIRESHGQPHSLWGGDEGMAGTNPNRGSEFCTASEALYSLALNFSATGRVDFADWTDRIAHNVLETQANETFTRRQYFQQANQLACSVGQHPFINHQEKANVFGLLSGYPCCTCNMHQAWPKFAANLWMQSGDHGLAAFSYAPSNITVELDGQTVSLSQTTDYPHRDSVKITVSLEDGENATFPLHLRIPGWAHGSRILVNDVPAAFPEAGTMAIVSREWKNGDIIHLHLPQEIEIRRGHQNGASVHLGPLLFALPIAGTESETSGEQITEIRPADDATPWNYALFENDLNPRPLRLNKFKLQYRADGIPAVECYGVQHPRWTAYHEESGPLPPSPSLYPKGNRPEKLTLIPYAKTKLRISLFPTVN